MLQDETIAKQALGPVPADVNLNLKSTMSDVERASTLSMKDEIPIQSADIVAFTSNVS